MVSAVLQTSFLGDMILTTPLLERLAERGRVVVVATPANAALLANHRAVHQVIVFDKRGADRGTMGMLRVARDLRGVGAATAYVVQGSLRTAALAQLAKIPERIGFETSPGRVLYTARVPFRRTLHHAQRVWQLASPADDALAPTTLRPTLYPSDDDRAVVETLLAAAGVGARDSVIALAPGSVWATKRWPSFEALAESIARDPQRSSSRFVVLGGAGDAPLAAAIMAALRTIGAPSAVDATGRLSLLQSAALIARARVLVSNDSAPLHLASAMNTPTVALFGPTILAFGFGPLAERSTIVERDGLACRPCHAHGPQSCPLGHWHCMRDLTPEEVARRVRALTDDAQ